MEETPPQVTTTAYSSLGKVMVKRRLPSGRDGYNMRDQNRTRYQGDNPRSSPDNYAKGANQAGSTRRRTESGNESEESATAGEGRRGVGMSIRTAMEGQAYHQPWKIEDEVGMPINKGKQIWAQNFNNDGQRTTIEHGAYSVGCTSKIRSALGRRRISSRGRTRQDEGGRDQ